MNPPRRLAFHPAFAALLAAMLALLAPAAALAQDEVVVSVKAQKPTVVPGDTIAIAVIFDHEDGWHIHPNQPVVPPEMGDFTPIATTITPQAPDTVDLWPIQWPKAKAFPVNFGDEPAMYEVYGGRAVAYLPIRIGESATPGSEITISLRLVYQACDDINCLMPEDTTRRITLKVISLEDAAALPVLPVDPDFMGFDPAVFASDAPPEPAVAASPSGQSPSDPGIDLGAFNLSIGVDPNSAMGLLVLLVIGFVGGFLLNLTPCVLPVIPLKVMGLSHAAGGNPKRALMLGAVMSAGVLAFWIGIGAAIAVLGVLGSTSELFGLWWFTLFLGLFIGIMGLGMMGMFTFQLPQAVYRVNPSHDTPAGSFLFGIMTAVLGLPCFAPFMGGATGVAIAVGPAAALATFGAIGAGMALPYMVLAARPQWVNMIPRTGPASELIKQVMGLLLLAAAAFFVGSGLVALVSERPYLGRTLHWWAVAAFATAAGVWLAFRTLQITSAPGRRAIFSGIGFFLALAGIGTAVLFTNMRRSAYEAELATRGPASDSGPLDRQLWSRYTPEVFASARAAGHVVIIDFTAEWCINCKFLKATVLSRDPVKTALLSGGVVSLTADLTSRGDPGWDLLRELEERGIPLLVVYTPGSDRPTFKSNAYTVEQVVAAVDEAKAVAKRGAQPGLAGAAR
jgi:thiol:disulfide interchange protein